MTIREKVVAWWDWRVYGWAYHSLRRMCARSPGIAILIELRIREYTEGIDPKVRESAETFHRHNRPEDGRA